MPVQRKKSLNIERFSSAKKRVICLFLLEYTNSLRSSAVHANTDGSDKPSTGTITAGELTYCQAVLWITPLLAAIEKANNQLAGIRQIEQKRQETK